MRLIFSSCGSDNRNDLCPFHAAPRGGVDIRPQTYPPEEVFKVTPNAPATTQPAPGPVVVLVGAPDSNVVDTLSWPRARLYPSRTFALELLGERARQDGKAARYHLWEIPEWPRDPWDLGAVVNSHPDEQLDCGPDGHVTTFRFR